MSLYALMDSDNVVQLTGLATLNLQTGVRTYLDATATVTFRVQTPDHVDVPGYVWPETMQYVVGSQGTFLGVLRDTIPWDADQIYRLVATVDAGPEQRRVWDMRLFVQVSQE
jgi:hypothetical protein